MFEIVNNTPCVILTVDIGLNCLLFVVIARTRAMHASEHSNIFTIIGVLWYAANFTRVREKATTYLPVFLYTHGFFLKNNCNDLLYNKELVLAADNKHIDDCKFRKLV